MKAADLDILLQEGEGVTLEFKEEPSTAQVGTKSAPSSGT